MARVRNFALGEKLHKKSGCRLQWVCIRLNSTKASKLHGLILFYACLFFPFESKKTPTNNNNLTVCFSPNFDLYATWSIYFPSWYMNSSWRHLILLFWLNYVKNRNG